MGYIAPSKFFKKTRYNWRVYITLPPPFHPLPTPSPLPSPPSPSLSPLPSPPRSRQSTYQYKYLR